MPGRQSGLRLTWMYDTCTLAPQEHGDFFRTLADRLRTSAPLSYPVYDIRGITDVNEVIRNFKSALELNGGIYNFGSPNHRNTYETVRAMFTALGWNLRSLVKNEEAFAAAPRDISMSPEKLNNSGITFSSTLDALVRNGRMEQPYK